MPTIAEHIAGQALGFGARVSSVAANCVFVRMAGLSTGATALWVGHTADSMMMESPGTYGPSSSSVWYLVLHLNIFTAIIRYAFA